MSRLFFLLYVEGVGQVRKVRTVRNMRKVISQTLIVHWILLDSIGSFLLRVMLFLEVPHGLHPTR